MIAKFPKPDELKNTVKIGAIWSFFLVAGRQVISLLTTSIISRILSPEDYGLIGMVTSLTSLIIVFSDLGLTTTVIQRSNISKIQLDNLYWLNIILGLFLWIICIIVSPFLANFYGRTELIGLSIALGATFFISGISAQPMALMRKKIESKEITKIEIYSLAIGSIIGIASAFLGLSYWSLVIQSLANQISRSILILLKRGYMPGSIKLDKETIPLVTFGLSLTLNGFLIYVARNLDNVLVGKYWGATILGVYNRAYFLMLLPSMLANGIASNLMVPALSALNLDRERFASSYRKALFMICLVGCPISTGLILTAEESVRLIYGNGWEDVIILIQLLGLASFTQPIFNTSGWLFTASGEAKKYMYITIVNVILYSITFFVLVPYGTNEMAIGYSLVSAFPILLFTTYFSHKVARISLRQSMLIIKPVIFSNIVMAISLFLLNQLIMFESYIINLGLKVVAGMLIYLLSLHFLLPNTSKNIILNFIKKN